MPARKRAKTPCSPCTDCCRRSKGIWMHPLEKMAIENAKRKGVLGTDPVSGKPIITVAKTKEGKKCAALRRGRCALHPVKPLQCVTFPFRVASDYSIMAPFACGAIKQFAIGNPKCLLFEEGKFYILSSGLKRNKLLYRSLSAVSRLSGLASIPQRVEILATTSDSTLLESLIKGVKRDK